MEEVEGKPPEAEIKGKIPEELKGKLPEGVDWEKVFSQKEGIPYDPSQIENDFEVSSSSSSSHDGEFMAKQLPEATKEKPHDILGDGTWLKVTTQKSVMPEVPQELWRVEVRLARRRLVGRLEHGPVEETSRRSFVVDEDESEAWLDAAVQTLRLGEVAVFYGSSECFEVEVETAEPAPNAPDLEKTQDKLDLIRRLRDNGNKWLAAGNLDRAKQRYWLSWRAADADDETRPSGSAAQANVAAVCLRRRDLDGALEACNKALEADDRNLKAWYRRARVLLDKDAFEAARADLKRALAVDPDNKDVKKLVADVRRKELEAERKARATFAGCFDKVRGFASAGRRERVDVDVVDPAAPPRPPSHSGRLTRCFLDVCIGGMDAGRIVLELFDDTVPKTCENFRRLCAGNDLTYKNSTFHRIIKDFMVQGGDITRGDGTGGISAFGDKFEDEAFVDRHDRPGLVSMANKGPNSNNSQFFITTANSCPHLDGKNVVFGRVASGFEVVKTLEQVETKQPHDVPTRDCRISDCGELEPIEVPPPPPRHAEEDDGPPATEG